MTPEAQDSIDQLVKREAEFRERKKIKDAAAAEKEKNAKILLKTYLST